MDRKNLEGSKATQLNEIVSRTEDGMHSYPDWKDTEAFIEALQAFLKSDAPESSGKKTSRIKNREEKILTVEDVLNPKKAV